MNEPQFLYSLNERPPLWRNLVYGVQWALTTFPALVVVASIAASALNLSAAQQVSFFQKILLLSGGFTLWQTLAGHRYPLQEGPATALLLTFVTLAPYGLAVIQGGFLCGALLVFTVARSRWMGNITPYFTPNVVGVILMLIAFTLIPHLLPHLIGATSANPQGEGAVFGVVVGLILLTAVLSHWLKGFWQTIGMILGIGIGTVIFWLWGRIDLGPVTDTCWFSLPGNLWTGMPRFHVAAIIASIFAYLAVVVNAVGSIHGVGEVVGKDQMEERVDRGISTTALAGMTAAALGVVGTVSYSGSPGVILVTRVASRYAQAMCGAILFITAFVPRLSGLLAAVPSPVIGAALCVALGSQVGAGIAVITAGGRALTGRDYLVVGLPVFIGTLVAALPPSFFSSLPTAVSIIANNGLVLGIVLVLLLEHGLLRNR
ncbi:MAG: uracil-xanthine permease family protein [Syntrophobacteria bacterium]